MFLPSKHEELRNAHKAEPAMRRVCGCCTRSAEASQVGRPARVTLCYLGRCHWWAGTAQGARLMREFRGNEEAFGPHADDEDPNAPPFELEMMEAALVVATGACPTLPDSASAQHALFL